MVMAPNSTFFFKYFVCFRTTSVGVGDGVGVRARVRFIAFYPKYLLAILELHAAHRKKQKMFILLCIMYLRMYNVYLFTCRRVLR